MAKTFRRTRQRESVRAVIEAATRPLRADEVLFLAREQVPQPVRYPAPRAPSPGPQAGSPEQPLERECAPEGVQHRTAARRDVCVWMQRGPSPRSMRKREVIVSV